MLPEFHIRCTFCHREFDSWENAMHQYFLHVRKCLELDDDKTAQKIARRTAKNQIMDYARDICKQIDEGKDYFS